MLEGGLDLCNRAFKGPRGNCVIPPPPMREGRVLSRCSGAAARTEDLLWKKHSAQTATEAPPVPMCMMEMNSVSVIYSALWLKILLFLQVKMCLFLFCRSASIHSIRDAFF